MTCTSGARAASASAAVAACPFLCTRTGARRTETGRPPAATSAACHRTAAARAATDGQATSHVETRPAAQTEACDHRAWMFPPPHAEPRRRARTWRRRPSSRRRRRAGCHESTSRPRWRHRQIRGVTVASRRTWASRCDVHGRWGRLYGRVQSCHPTPRSRRRQRMCHPRQRAGRCETRLLMPPTCRPRNQPGCDDAAARWRRKRARTGSSETGAWWRGHGDPPCWRRTSRTSSFFSAFSRFKWVDCLVNAALTWASVARSELASNLASRYICFAFPPPRLAL